MWRWLVLVFICGAHTACNGLFYYPDDIVYTDPSIAELEYEPFTIEGRDGETLSGWYLPTPWKRQGLVLHFHGNAQNMTAHILFAAWMLDAGYDLVIFDYRGYGKSTGDPERIGMVKDGLDMVAHVNEKYHQQDEDFIILAQSLGGAIAVPTVAFLDEGQPDVLILDSTFASYRDIAREKVGNFFLTWPFQYPLSFLVSDDLSPVDFADQITEPVLMIHGTKDGITPIDDAKDLYDRIGSDDKNLWVIPGGTHTSAFYEYSPYREKLLSYLCNYANDKKLCQRHAQRFVARYERRVKIAEENKIKRAKEAERKKKSTSAGSIQ